MHFTKVKLQLEVNNVAYMLYRNTLNSQNHCRNKFCWHVTQSHRGAKSEILIISIVCRWQVFQNLVTIMNTQAHTRDQNPCRTELNSEKYLENEPFSKSIKTQPLCSWQIVHSWLCLAWSSKTTYSYMQNLIVEIT